MQENAIKEEDNSGQCPDGFTGLVPHAVFCQFYYLCDNGTPNLRECPSGLYFNVRESACDYPANVPECVDGQSFKSKLVTPNSYNELNLETQVLGHLPPQL